MQMLDRLDDSFGRIMVSHAGTQVPASARC